MKFVTPLHDATRKELLTIFHDDPSFKPLIRAHAVVLSDSGYLLEQLADIFDGDRDMVSIWCTVGKNTPSDRLYKNKCIEWQIIRCSFVECGYICKIMPKRLSRFIT